MTPPLAMERTLKQVRPPLDLRTIGRAAFLHVEPIDGGYRVWGDANEHYCSLAPEYQCDCEHFEIFDKSEDPRAPKRADGMPVWRYVICKHLCAALIHEGDMEALSLLFEWNEQEKARVAARARAEGR